MHSLKCPLDWKDYINCINKETIKKKQFKLKGNDL